MFKTGIPAYEYMCTHLLAACCPTLSMTTTWGMACVAKPSSTGVRTRTCTPSLVFLGRLVRRQSSEHHWTLVNTATHR